MFPSPFARRFGMVSTSFVTANHTVNSRGKLSENRTVIKKLSFALRPRCPIFVYGGAISALPGNALLWLQRCVFGTAENPFLLTTAAQNMRVLLRKSPLCRKHFFEWLKTTVLLFDCGTVTLKSPPSRGSDAPHVHPRLRKCRSRCTLDCGFKTSESPALRGFVGGLRALATAALYLVLKSNGLPRPKIQLKKFGFSLKITSANSAKKLPPQRCSKSLFIAFFSFAHKRPTFAFTGESVYTLGFRRKIAHKGTHGETGAFPPSATARLCVVSEIPFIPPCFYIHTFPGSL